VLNRRGVEAWARRFTGPIALVTSPCFWRMKVWRQINDARRQSKRFQYVNTYHSTFYLPPLYTGVTQTPGAQTWLSQFVDTGGQILRPRDVTRPWPGPGINPFSPLPSRVPEGPPVRITAPSLPAYFNHENGGKSLVRNTGNIAHCRAVEKMPNQD
jgi:hypothetical protein